MLRFFRSKDKPADDQPAQPAPEAPDIADEQAEDDDALTRAALAAEDDGDEGMERSWTARAAAVIPGGASTGSKRPAALYGPDTDFWPTHYVAARGCELETPSGQHVVDCSMALGAVALGYGDGGVRDAVQRAVAAGNVSGLSSVLEVTVAERLCDAIPCAERVRFLKTGAEAVAAAVRIARAATGRMHVVGSGYFGWLDWWSEHAGVPAGAHADFTGVPFDDVEALRAAVRAAGRDLAAIVLEPVVERLPSAEWMAEARALCDASGALLVFDEMKTGFRLASGGYQQYAGVTPDLAAFGKAMANGFPLAAVVGRAGPMEEGCGRTWISSTLAGEAVGLAAAAAVIDRHAEEDVCAALWRTGGALRESVGAAMRTSGIEGVTLEGIDPMWFLRWDSPARESAWLGTALAHGVLFKRGAYNYAALPHEELLTDIERAASAAFVELVETADGDAE
jgi:glutamate-1-semialdehyde 2,1-aminomutase